MIKYKIRPYACNALHRDNPFW